MYTYMYRLLELFMIRCHSLAMPESQQNDFFAVKYLKNPAFRHKKSPIVIIWQQGKTIGVIGFEPTASCSQSRRSSQAELHPEKTTKTAINRCILHNKSRRCNKIISQSQRNRFPKIPLWQQVMKSSPKNSLHICSG